MGLTFFVLVRFGLLTLAAYMVFGGLSQIAPFTLTSSAPYFGAGLFVTLLAFAFATYGWHTSQSTT